MVRAYRYDAGRGAAVDLLRFAGAIGVRDEDALTLARVRDHAAVRRERGLLVVALVLRDANHLLRIDIERDDVVRAAVARCVRDDVLAGLWRPRRRGVVAAVERDLLRAAATRGHDEDLRTAVAIRDERDLRAIRRPRRRRIDRFVVRDPFDDRAVARVDDVNLGIAILRERERDLRAIGRERRAGVHAFLRR